MTAKKLKSVNRNKEPMAKKRGRKSSLEIENEALKTEIILQDMRMQHAMQKVDKRQTIIIARLAKYVTSFLKPIENVRDARNALNTICEIADIINDNPFKAPEANMECNVNLSRQSENKKVKEVSHASDE